MNLKCQSLLRAKHCYPKNPQLSTRNLFLGIFIVLYLIAPKYNVLRVPDENNNKVYKDESEIFKSNVPGVIDRVHTNIFNSDGLGISFFVWNVFVF